MRRRSFIGRFSAAPAFLRHLSASQAARPNIIWILAEDLGPQLACYGYKGVDTPNLDRLADEGIRFGNAHTTAPVCSASRSAFNAGMYQTTTGTHNHRSHRKDGYRLPDGVKLISHRLQEGGYFTANVRGDIAPGVRGAAKTDFNFDGPQPFIGTHWNQREKGQPFYAQINLQATHKGPAFVEARKQQKLINPARVELPPYWPDHPVVRNEFANYLDCVQLLDRQVGAIMEVLKRDELLENTLLFFMGDNGRCLIRGKQWCYDAGTHVPMIARFPGHVRPGGFNPDPVLSLDMTATSLAAAGIELPAQLHGRPLWGAGSKRRDYIVTARDRCDMTVDRIRCVRDAKFSFIRNFMPERPYTQFNRYIRDEYPTLGAMKELHAEGRLKGAELVFMADRKPEVEFYDLAADPHEVRNLSTDPAQQGRIKAYSKILDEWIRTTGDKGEVPEPAEAYADQM